MMMAHTTRMVEITIDYHGSLRCQAKHGPSGAEIETDAPVDNHGRGEAFSPTDLAATSLGMCMMTVMGIAAQARKVELTGSKLTVRKHMSSEPPRRIAVLEVDLSIPLPPSHPARDVLEEVGRRCPVALSLHPDVEQKITFHWNG